MADISQEHPWNIFTTGLQTDRYGGTKKRKVFVKRPSFLSDVLFLIQLGGSKESDKHIYI